MRNKKGVLIMSTNENEVRREEIKKIVEERIKRFIEESGMIDEIVNVILEQTDENWDPSTKNQKIRQKKVITELLYEVGVVPSTLGFEYIREALMMILKEPNYMHEVTKGLYPQIAQKYDSTGARVERAIRHSIEMAWNKISPETIEKYFVNTVSYQKGKPTNSEFLSVMAEYIRLHNIQAY